MDARVTEFPVAEAKARFSELLDRAEKGESLTIRRHGKPVARLVPAQGDTLTVEERRERRLAWEARRDAADGPRLGPGLTIKELINEGRRF
jgi:prevent-host-death family protein